MVIYLFIFIEPFVLLEMLDILCNSKNVEKFKLGQYLYKAR